MMANELPSGWRLARFDEILTKVDRKFFIDDSQEYKTVGVRWYGNGTFIRERLLGANINRKQQWEIQTGDIVYNKLFAWKGAFAVADESVNGCIVSDKFPTYKANLDLVVPKYLSFYFTMPEVALQAQDLSKGAAALSKFTLNPPQFWDLTIPLPPSDEQNRIVDYLEALSTRITKAQSLQEKAGEETVALVESELNSIVQELEKKYETKYLEELLIDANYGTSVKCFSEREKETIPVLRIPNVASEKVTLSKLKYGSLSKSEFDKTVLKQGDILIVRTNGSAELVGRCAVVPKLHEPMAFASYMIRIRCNQEIISSEFLQLVLRQQRTAGFLFDFARTSAGQYNVSLGRLKKTKIPIPPLDEQRRIVAYLDSVQARLASLRELQSATGEELSALLPSVLDKAFKGEL